MKEITLSKGHVALIDDEDYDLVSQYKWHSCANGNLIYARAAIPGDKYYAGLLMHRLIMSPSKLQWIDHIDHDGLNNQKVNLRYCNNRQNRYNSRPARGMKYKGVTYNGKNKKYIRAQIRINDKIIHLGNFPTLEDAARAYDKKAIEIQGEFAYLNFPEAQNIT